MKIDPKCIGNGLAFIQSKIDDAFDFAFKKLTKSTDKELPKDTHKIKEYTFKVGGFIGNIGKNYYKRYNEIKEEKAKNSRM